MIKKIIKNAFISSACFLLFNSINCNATNIEANLNIEKTIHPSIYSWKEEDMFDEARHNELIELTNTFRVNEIYQYIPSENFTDSEALKTKVSQLKDKGISVYYLTGDPTWWQKIDSITKRINRVVEYNNSVDEDSKLSGIVLDIEPWSGNEDYDQATYADTLRQAYEYAQSKNVKMITTIPFWLEEETLEVVIANCDRVSVMNYTRSNPIKNLAEEIPIAKKYNKELEHISETKEPDGSGIPDSITYFNYGLDPLNEDWISMKQSEDTLYMSYHDVESMKIMEEKYPDSLVIAKNLVIIALNKKDEASIAKATDAINVLNEGNEKEYLLNVLENLSNTDIPSLKPSKVSANLDLYIKSENMLCMTLSTNSITFEDYSGIDDLIFNNAVNISINSSLPYQLNSYLLSEIENADKTAKIEKDLLNIKINSDTDYKVFTDINQKLVLEEYCNTGNNNHHSIDLRLKGTNAYKADVYKTVIKFEAEQK